MSDFSLHVLNLQLTFSCIGKQEDISAVTTLEL